MQELVIGIGGAAGDGLDKSGDTLARTAGRLGLHVYAYNSYQSIVRGGHIWLRVRISGEKVYTHGDTVNALVALNQDAIERHAAEVCAGGTIVFNADRLKCPAELTKPGVEVLGISMSAVTAEIVKEHGPIQPIMQNTVDIGAIMFLAQLDLKEVEEVIVETFRHKGQKVVDLNIGLLKAGYEYAKAHGKPIHKGFSANRKRRPFMTGNEAIAIGAVASGCKFYSAYPMTPASSILHWMANHSEKVGVLVKQCEDELSVINMAIGAGIAGARSMCATSGGGFALMTEAVGMAGIMEVPLVCVEVQRGGPSTGLPTKTEQGDLNQVYGASQGDFPRMIVAPRDVEDAFHTTVEAFNMAEKYQMPVLIMSDLLLSEHPETVEPETFRHDVPIDRGQLVAQWDTRNGKYKRFAFNNTSGVSPRALPGTPDTLYISPSDDHDEESILISDMFTAPPVRRKIQEKRQIKMCSLLKDLPAPQLAGPKDADVTLVGWGSSYGAIHEAANKLTASGVKTNYLIIKYILPFHSEAVISLLKGAGKKIAVEVNYTCQMARHVRSETGIGMDDFINVYDGEPLSADYVVSRVKDIMGGKRLSLNVTREEAREIAYHYLRTHHNEKLRPANITIHESNGRGEATYHIELVKRDGGEQSAELEVGVETGSTYSFKSLQTA